LNGQYEKNDKIDIISFSVNKINALIIDEIREAILKVFDNSNSKVIIDLKGVEYVDSSGFGLFPIVHESCQEQLLCAEICKS